jgi:hypothetical protein
VFQRPAVEVRIIDWKSFEWLIALLRLSVPNWRMVNNWLEKVWMIAVVSPRVLEWMIDWKGLNDWLEKGLNDWLLS